MFKKEIKIVVKICEVALIKKDVPSFSIQNFIKLKLKQLEEIKVD